MEGRYPSAVFVVLMNCADPLKDAEMNDWYARVHIPEVTRPGISGNATRYANPAAKGSAEDPRYLGVYEINRTDVEAAWREHLSHRKGFTPSPPYVARTLMGVYRRVGDLAAPPRARRTGGAIVALTDCRDPSREAEFNRWYDQVHVPDILSTGACWSAMRFASIEPGNGQPRYLALYDTEGSGAAAFKEMAKRFPRDPSRRSDLLQPRFAGGFDLIYSQVAAAAHSTG